MRGTLSRYKSIFIDEDYPSFIDKYLATKSLTRLSHVTFFCGCDYTNLFSPKCMYTRLDHSVNVAHMTWHFTHDKGETIAALLHDIGTPCFAHCIDYLMGDYTDQESSERNIADVAKLDSELMECLVIDGIDAEDLRNLSVYPVLENKSPRLCTDRLDGVLATVAIWLHIDSLSDVKAVYNDMTILTNRLGRREIGFRSIKMAEKFAVMSVDYSTIMQRNSDKYTMQYIADVVKLLIDRGLLTMDDLYVMQEDEIIELLDRNIASWQTFRKATHVISSDDKPDGYYVSISTKKRRTIPVVQVGRACKRVTEVSAKAKKAYSRLGAYRDVRYAHVAGIREL